MGLILVHFKGVHMIIDVTGIELTPSNNGEHCLGNGEHVDEKGNLIECCCDECDYFLYCYQQYIPTNLLSTKQKKLDTSQEKNPK